MCTVRNFYYVGNMGQLPSFELSFQKRERRTKNEFFFRNTGNFCGNMTHQNLHLLKILPRNDETKKNAMVKFFGVMYLYIIQIDVLSKFHTYISCDGFGL